MALLPGSPAIGAGNIALIPAAVTTDQRGFARIVSGTVDIGAYEVQSDPAGGQHDRRRQRLPARNARPARGGRPGQRPARRSDDHFRPDCLRRAADDHPDRQPARAEQHERDGDDHRPGGGRDGQRRRAEPGVPGRRGRHGVNLGTDDHRRLAGGKYPTGDGGGLLNYGTTTLTDCTVSGNSAKYNGGGLDNPSGTITLTNCTISGNSAGFGGGAVSSYKGTTTLTNCTISGNSAADRRRRASYKRHGHARRLHHQRQLRRAAGGGLLNFGGTATLDQLHRQRQLPGLATAAACTTASGTTTLTDCTVSGNSAADYGGGLNIQTGTATIGNTIVAGNTARSGT